MRNLKIKLNNEAEAEEVKRLAVKAGYKLDALFGRKWSAEFCYLVLCENMSAGFANEIMADGDKPLSIGELRDMVVLKRNDVSDATHESSIYKYFKACDDWYYFDLGCTDKWQKSSGAKPEYYEKLKTIEKKEMKEYLMPSRNYEYILTDAREALEPHAEDWIEIPEGANIAVLSLNGFIVFYKDYNSNVFYATEPGVDFSFKWELDGNGVGNREIIWQRDQDEPFLTPECTLNDQYAEIEQVRQVEIHGTVKAEPDFNFGASQSSGGVDETLAERQSTYGNFEDVAFVTENIMSILAQVRVNGLNDLPNTHRMALYMIASKMARIVNGDFNHLDSWHDIGGYAKLIEKLIKGE